MFNNDKIKMLERRIALLEPNMERLQEYENKIFRLESRLNCFEGKHQWELRQKIIIPGLVYLCMKADDETKIVCKHCGKEYEKKPSKTKSSKRGK